MTSEDRSGKNDREYSNDEITVYWKPSKCIHVTTCYRDLIEVFNPRKRPWINMKGASSEEIMRVVEKCPTEALSYSMNKDFDDTKKESTETREEEIVLEVPPGAEVRVMKDGPLIIKGNFTFTGSNGSEITKMKMLSICRCGQSHKMPFCDGTHRKVGFSAD